MQIQSTDFMHGLLCPHCRDLLALVEPEAFSTFGPGFFLDDGDSVPGMREAIAQLNVQEGFDCILSVGTCSTCRAGYYVVEATFVDGSLEDLLDWYAADKGQPCSYRLVRHPEQRPWLHIRRSTADGRDVHEHMFGPFPTDVAALKGPHGVSACGARGREGAWESARQLVAGLWEQINMVNSTPQPA